MCLRYNSRMTTPLLTVKIRDEQDVIAARLRARQVAEVCGFSMLDQARIAATVSELARTLVGHSATGEVEFAMAANDALPALQVKVADNFPGDASAIWINEKLPASTAKLMNGYKVISATAAGSHVAFWKNLPADATFDLEHVQTLLRQLDPLPGNVALSEANHQNGALTKALHDLQERQDELTQVTRRLEETNARIASLNVLLDQKAHTLIGADQRKDEFLALLSHELRSPLSTVSLAAQMLGSVKTIERAQELGAMLARQAGHMTRLVEDLLDISRVTRGLVTLQRASVDLAEVIQEAAEQQQASLAVKKHALTLSIAATPCLVDGDKTRLVQVMGNLLANAIRYTAQGGAIQVTLVRNGGTALMSVQDNGRGIAAEFIPHLFDLYVQEESSSERKVSGLGIGLALVKSLVELHQGQVRVSSEGRDKGSLFSVELPLLEVVSAPTLH